MVDVSLTIQLAGRDQARVLAALHLDAAFAGYANIFPEDAPPPTLDDVIEQWRYWLGPDWDSGRRAFVAQEELATVRMVTARFHRVEAATDAGYELGYVNGSGVRIITGCIAHPTAGAMGYHYFNKELIDDLVIDPLKPEGLVYAPGPDGGLHLAAVEWVVPGARSNPPGVSEPPTVFGMEM